jgi:hypothetical protein
MVENFTERDRIGVIEMIWEVAYSDGVLTGDEDALIRRVCRVDLRLGIEIGARQSSVPENGWSVSDNKICDALAKVRIGRPQ